MSENKAQMVHLRLRLRKAVLGARKSSTIRKLDTCIENGKTMWEISQSHWLWALREARDSMGLRDVSLDFVRLPLRVEVSRAVNPYVRTYRPPGGGPRKEEMFEAVRSGTIINVDVLILGTIEDESEQDGKRPPTADELIGMFEVMGYSIGISPWGGKYAYGRFAVEQNAPTERNKQSEQNGREQNGREQAGESNPGN